jgi:hypothetical protein
MPTNHNATGTYHLMGPGGVAATHGQNPALRVLAGSATADEANTVRPSLLPIACLKLEHIRFHFDASFLLPTVRTEMPTLKQIMEDHAQDPVPPATTKRYPLLSIFGHADPVGSDDYNKLLSGRRAAVVYALLTRRYEIWEDLYSNGGKFAGASSSDSWGLRSLQVMLNAIPDPDNPDPIPINEDGTMDDDTKAAIKKFQSANGLNPDGSPGPQTRKALFLAYMDFLCVDADANPFKYDPKDNFLGHHADDAGKADFQGCGEFNPLRVFSKSESDQFKSDSNHTARNEKNAVNRRVMILLFRPCTQITLSAWPCPKAKEGPSGCKKRFWSDGDKRRNPTDDQREFLDTRDTFACRFYQRLITYSPCEKPPPGMGWLAVRVFFLQRPMRGTFVTFCAMDGSTPGDPIGAPVRTDADGVARMPGPVPQGYYACQVEDHPPRKVSTVFDQSDPEILVLPIGRPYLSVEGDRDFLANQESPPSGSS